MFQARGGQVGIKTRSVYFRVRRSLVGTMSSGSFKIRDVSVRTMDSLVPGKGRSGLDDNVG